METVERTGYEEELSLMGLQPDKYAVAVRDAVAELGWQPAGVNGNTMFCITPGRDYYFSGELVAITVAEDRVLFRSMLQDQFSPDEDQNRHNAERYKTAIAAAVIAAEKKERSIHPMHREKFGALIPSKTYTVTPVLLYINVLVFLLMVLAGISPLEPTAAELYEWGGMSRTAVVGGEWWRLLTAMFLHGGAAHLAGNAWALLYIGMFLEPLLGKFRFAAAYILTGICAGLLSIVMHADSVGIGASGAIFGMYGIFLAMLTTSHIEKTMRTTMLRSILLFVVFNLLMGLKGNVDNAAHIGGLVSGFALGYYFYPGVARRVSFKSQLISAFVATSAVLLLMFFVLTRF